MTKEETIQLLQENGYVLHPVFNIYIIPSNALSIYFKLNSDNEVIVGKLKWNQVSLKDYKTVKLAYFNPHHYNLKTQLDRKIEQEAKIKKAKMREAMLQKKY